MFLSVIRSLLRANWHLEQILTRRKSLILNTARLNCAWRGIQVSLTTVTVSTQIPLSFDVLYLGHVPFPCPKTLLTETRLLTRSVFQKLL